MKSITLRRPLLSIGAALFTLLAMPSLLRGNTPEDLAFSLDCPPDVTISCKDDLYNLDKYGKAYIHDYSGYRPAGTPKVVRDLNSCGKGTITRTWTAEDYNWNIHTCSQTIYVTGGGLTIDDIIWPKDYEVEGCYPNTSPKSLPSGHGYPNYTNTDCAQPMASYKDEVFEFSKSCKKVIRKWTVIDWCEYSPNQRPLPGHFTYYQIIKVSASEKPTIVCPPDSVYVSNKDCDSTSVTLDPVRAFTSCDSNLTITHNSPYADRQGADASGKYPVGTTKVTFHIEYGCGKDTTCTVEITVQSGKGPVPYCRDGIVTTLMGVDINKDGIFDEGMVEIWAKDLDIGSYHPCGRGPLTFSFDPDSVVMSRVFTCDDLGKNEVRMYVTDPEGNQTYCRTYVIIQNNNVQIPDCEPDTTGGGGGTAGPIIRIAEIKGDVKTDLGRAIPGAEMEMLAYNQDTILLAFSDTTINARLDTVTLPNGTTRVEIRIDTSIVTRYDTSYADKVVNAVTGADGKYAFGSWKQGYRYDVSGRKGGRVLDGLDVMDALKLIQYLIGAEELENPYRYLAADSDGDGEVTYTDFEILYDVIMGVKNEFPGGRNWELVPAKHQFADPKNPWKNPVPSFVSFDPLRQDEVVPFIGVKIGDLDGTIRPSYRTNLTQQRMADAWWFDMKDEQVPAGSDFEIQLPLAGLHAGIIRLPGNTGSLEFKGYEFATAAGHMDRVILAGDEIFVGFAGQDHITLNFVAKTAVSVQALWPSSALNGELFDAAGQQYRPLIRYKQTDDLLSATAFPNPFGEAINFDVISGQQGDMNFRIYDVSGRVLLERSYTLYKGENRISVEANELPNTGFYIYEMVRGGLHTRGTIQKIR